MIYCSCPCYRFGKNMGRAGFGSCFIQVNITLFGEPFIITSTPDTSAIGFYDRTELHDSLFLCSCDISLI